MKTVKRTMSARKFVVEIREKGREPKIVADQVSLDVAKTICRELVRPSVYAVVRRVETPRRCIDTGRRYSVWLWDTQTRSWDRATEPMSLRQAYRWVRGWERHPVDCISLIWPNWASEPPSTLEAVG